MKLPIKATIYINNQGAAMEAKIREKVFSFAFEAPVLRLFMRDFLLASNSDIASTVQIKISLPDERGLRTVTLETEENALEEALYGDGAMAGCGWMRNLINPE